MSSTCRVVLDGIVKECPGSLTQSRSSKPTSPLQCASTATYASGNPAFLAVGSRLASIVDFLENLQAGKLWRSILIVAMMDGIRSCKGQQTDKMSRAPLGHFQMVHRLKSKWCSLSVAKEWCVETLKNLLTTPLGGRSILCKPCY